MTSRQSVSSILKPSKVRAPLKEIEPVDQDADENTESLPKRKVSFSGMNKIKMYNTGATSLTVHQAPMFDEQISILSDSSNAEKTKLLLEASQKSNQTTIESTNCTTMEDNNRVCIEYECPNDNMEMTEALSCKIFSDTIYTIENNGFEHGDYNSDYSDNNMEFTEVIKTAQILTNENDSDFSSTETLNDNNKHPDAQSSNMELTCVTSFQKSILPHCKSDMELTELTDRKIHENNCELVFEQGQLSISTTSEMSSDISMDIDQTSEGNDINCIINNSKLLVSEQNDSLVPKPSEYEQHNYSDLLIDIDNQNIQSSPSLISTGLSFFSEMFDSNKPCRVEELKKDILNIDTSTVDQYHSFENNKIKNYSRKSMAHTNTVIVEEKSTKNKYLLNTSVVVKKNDQKSSNTKSQTQSLEKENTLNLSVIRDENQQINALVSIHNESQSSENDEISNTPVMLGENQQKIYSQQSNAPVFLHNESQSFEDEDISDTPVVVEKNQQNIYCRKSIAPTLDFNESKFSESEGMSISNQTQSPIRDLSYTSVTVKANRPKKYSRKTVGPSSILVHKEPPKYIKCDNYMDEESSKSNSRMSMTCMTTKCISDMSLMSKDSNRQLLDLSNKHVQTELKPVFPNIIVDDDFNSPFRKKSRLSIATNLKSQTANETNPYENYEETNKMDISVELSNDNSMLKISSKELHISSPLCLLNDISNSFQKITNSLINEDGNSLVFKNNSFEEKLEGSDKSSRKEKHLNDLIENIEKLEEVKNGSLQISDNINMTNRSLKFEDDSISHHNVDKIVNDICTEGLSNISISNITHTNYENRKRSYTNVDINYEEPAKEKDFEVVPPIKDDSFKENLNIEVIEFLEKWENQFIDKILVKVKCTNSKWTFNALNDNIVLTIKYLPILKDHNFLKVEDISFTTKNIIEHEILKFGINWILSKYDPKVYKQVCFSSRDIELLLKSLLEDVKYISKMMNNMFYVSDMYCVKFEDNLAQFCLHSMKCQSMTSIQISLANIHKLSVKDITVNCVFGSFNINLLNEILNELPKDYNILESLIVQLKNQMYR
ncbi:Hypothetical protein CINCED_3A006248 [Cinara cedri]|uniref:Uncharacterized protein n=1 Tax=Cinara cedri TaxID=506608 RepID=A0A5E4NHT3_9HEMI|nr:Hypothetical protein CINCED_3A006248 [Cinara cedri]